MKLGLILGIAITGPAFVCLCFGVDESESALAALMVGVLFSVVCGLLISNHVSAGSAASIVWWVISGFIVGIAAAVAAAAVTEGPENWAGGMILIVGAPSLRVLGALVGAVIGMVQYSSRSDKG